MVMTKLSFYLAKYMAKAFKDRATKKSKIVCLASEISNGRMFLGGISTMSCLIDDYNGLEDVPVKENKYQGHIWERLGIICIKFQVELFKIKE